MKKISAYIAMTALVVSFSGSAMAMNGRHVTVKGANLLLTTIQNNAVAGSPQTISCQASGPEFSFDGTKIAFWRNNGGKWYISVMDASTKAITDLLDVSTWAGAGPGNGADLRWPAGSWIYFKKPSTAAIWRINSADPTQKNLVTDYGSSLGAGWDIYGFSLTPDVRKALVSFGAQYPWRSHQYIHNFPPTASGPGAAPNFMFDLPNCNPALSPSSKWAERFWDGEHMEMIIYKWNTTQNTYVEENGVGNCTNPNSPPTICISTAVNMESWSGAADWVEFFEGPNWAVNSDRWMTVAGLLPGTAWEASEGSNSILLSWKDKKSINVTQNSMGTSCLGGSLFVGGGPANYIQDIDGVWRDLQGNVTAAGEPLNPSARLQPASARVLVEGRNLRIAVSDRAAHAISVLDARGRSVSFMTGIGVNEYVLGPKALKAGLYFVKVRAGGNTETASVVMP